MRVHVLGDITLLCRMVWSACACVRVCEDVSVRV